jgi:hypothetical protein
MASPYDSAIDMFNLPRFGVGASPFPRRADPMEDARRRFLEGGGAQPEPQDFVAQRAMEAADPFGVMQEVENLRREREEQGFISDIASLNPSGETYSSDLLGLIQKNPRIAQSKGALGLIDVQRQLAPKPKDYTTQFRDPVYRTTYQQKVKAGMDPDMAYEQTLSESANEEMAIDLIRAGIPAERHGELMTGGAFDRRKVAQAIYGAKPRPGYDLPLSGDAKTEFEGIVQELAQARAGTAEPTDDEKRQFLAPRANTTWSEQEWADAYNKAKPLAQQRALTEASNRLNQFRQTYGDYYKLPEGLTGASAPQQPAALAPQAAPAPLSTPGAPQPPPGPQNAPQAPPVPQEQPAPVPRKPGEPVTFENLTADVDTIESGEKTKRSEDFKMREDIRQQESKQWEVAKNKLLQGLDADILRSLSPSPGPKEFAVFERIGVKPDAMAFRKPDGTDVSWYEAFVALAQDPRIQQLQQRNSAPARPPVGTSPSGAKVVIGQPVKVQ